MPVLPLRFSLVSALPALAEVGSMYSYISPLSPVTVLNMEFWLSIG